MNKYFLYIPALLLAFILFAGNVHAQVTKVPDTTNVFPVKKKKPKPITKEMSVGLRFNTDGWSLFVDRGKVKNVERNSDYFYNIRLWQVELEEKKHPQEIRRSNTPPSRPDQAKPFIYGKVNNFFALKVGYGGRKMIAGKPDPGTVAIHWVYVGGISIGMEKPYYVDAGGVPVKYTDTTKEIFLSQNAITGSSGFTQGIGETKIVPGAHFKSGLHFDFASSKTTKMAIETGLNAEIYSRAIQIMANQKDVPYFLNVYASFQIGKRWPQKK
jgi:hypothetical protein